MLKIGEFAGLTGLSVKALRHYDEIGVLLPAEVDERSGYRFYAEGQVRTGVEIRMLRDAEVPLPEISDAVSGGTAEEALEAHRLRVLERREREDRAFLRATTGLRGLAAPVEVFERQMPAQHFAGQAIAVPADDGEAVSDEDASAVFGALFARLRAAGAGPSGPFWTAVRARDRGTVELVCCWPTPSEVPEVVLGPDHFSGVLPARTELVARWRPVGGVEPPEGSLHPAAIALFDGIAERGAELGGAEVRQAVIGQTPDDAAVELSVTVR